MLLFVTLVLAEGAHLEPTPTEASKSKVRAEASVRVLRPAISTESVWRALPVESKREVIIRDDDGAVLARIIEYP